MMIITKPPRKVFVSLLYALPFALRVVREGSVLTPRPKCSSATSLTSKLQVILQDPAQTAPFLQTFPNIRHPQPGWQNHSPLLNSQKNSVLNLLRAVFCLFASLSAIVDGEFRGEGCVLFIFLSWIARIQSREQLNVKCFVSISTET